MNQKLGVKTSKEPPKKPGAKLSVKTSKSGGFVTPVKIGVKPVKTPPVTRQNQPPVVMPTIPGSNPFVTLGSQFGFNAGSGQPITTGLEGITNPLESINNLANSIRDPNTWFSIVAILVGVVLVFLAVNALLQSEIKSAASNFIQSQGFSIPKPKVKRRK